MVPDEDQSLSRFWRLFLLRIAGEPGCRPRPLGPHSYGQRYTYRERPVGTTQIIQFRRLLRDDYWAFTLATSDCLSGRDPGLGEYH